MFGDELISLQTLMWETADSSSLLTRWTPLVEFEISRNTALFSRSFTTLGRPGLLFLPYFSRRFKKLETTLRERFKRLEISASLNFHHGKQWFDLFQIQKDIYPKAFQNLLWKIDKNNKNLKCAIILLQC